MTDHKDLDRDGEYLVCPQCLKPDSKCDCQPKDLAEVAAENIPHTGTCTRREGTGKYTLNNDTDIIRKAIAPMQAELDEAKAEIEQLEKLVLQMRDQINSIPASGGDFISHKRKGSSDG